MPSSNHATHPPLDRGRGVGQVSLLRIYTLLKIFFGFLLGGGHGLVFYPGYCFGHTWPDLCLSRLTSLKNFFFGSFYRWGLRKRSDGQARVKVYPASNFVNFVNNFPYRLLLIFFLPALLIVLKFFGFSLFRRSQVILGWDLGYRRQNFFLIQPSDLGYPKKFLTLRVAIVKSIQKFLLSEKVYGGW
jgi:hypothetical protein